MTSEYLQLSWCAVVTEIVVLLQGIARQRQAIVNGLRESVSHLAAVKSCSSDLPALLVSMVQLHNLAKLYLHRGS